jgi:hypothetical protein
MKSGNLNFLKPSGPLQACNGTALPFTVVIECTMTSVNVFEFQRALLSTVDVNYNKYNVSSVNKILKHGWILSKYHIYLNARQGYSLKFGA